MEDSLKIDYDEETGQLQLDWDPNDPKWSWMNHLTEEEVGAIITESLQRKLDDFETESSA